MLYFIAYNLKGRIIKTFCHTVEFFLAACDAIFYCINYYHCPQVEPASSHQEIIILLNALLNLCLCVVIIMYYFGIKLKATYHLFFSQAMITCATSFRSLYLSVCLRHWPISLQYIFSPHGVLTGRTTVLPVNCEDGSHSPWRENRGELAH